MKNLSYTSQWQGHIDREDGVATIALRCSTNLTGVFQLQSFYDFRTLCLLLETAYDMGRRESLTQMRENFNREVDNMIVGG